MDVNFSYALRKKKCPLHAGTMIVWGCVASGFERVWQLAESAWGPWFLENMSVERCLEEVRIFVFQTCSTLPEVAQKKTPL